MPRNMSFMLTTQQVYDQTKDVTRRCGWWFAKQGDDVQACEKCQGLGKGGKIVRICMIKIASTRPEPLRKMTDDLAYGYSEVVREGFPEMSPAQFVEMFCDHNKVLPEEVINRIRFTYPLSPEDRAFLEQVPLP